FKLIKRFNNIEPFDTFTAMRNGSIAYGNGQSLKVLDPASRKIGELKWGGASGQVFAASPMDEDAIVLLTTEKRTLVQLRYRTGEVVKKYAYANEPVALTMASGGNRFWVASRDGALMAFDPNIPLPAEFCRLDAFGSVLLATPAEGEFALCADGKKLTAVWSPEKIIDFNLPPVAPLSLAVTPDGKSVLVGSSEGLHTADIPKNASGKKLSLTWSSSAPRDAFHHLIMAPNGRFLASANETEVFAWDWPSLKLLGQTTAPGKVKSLAIASDSRSMSFGDATNQLTIVSVPAGETVVAKIDPSKPEASKPEKSMPETPKSETPKVPAAAPMVKLDIPPADKIAEATKVIREQFAKEYTVAKKVPAERASLAEKFVRLARETTDDAVARYVLLTEARDLANKWSQVEEALDLLGSEYAVEPIDLRLAALRVFLKTATTKESAEETCESIFDSANECFANDRFDTARSFLTLGIAAAAKAQKATFQSQFAKFDKELKGAELDYERMQKAKTVLANGDDEAAHLEVGRYLVFRKNDLVAGLAHLAKGGPDDLPEAARKDLTNPDDAKKQQDAGDAWWRLAEKAKGGVRNVYLSRAGHWYQKAAAKATGLSLAVINDRLKTIEDSSVVVGGGDSGNAEVRSFKGHRGAVLSLVVAADGRRIYSGGADGTIRSWDIATGRQLSSFNAGFQVASFEFSIDQRYLLTYDGSTARTWSTAKIPKILQAVESIIVPNWQDLNRFVTVNSNNSLATNLPTIASSSGGFLSNVKIRLTEPFPRARLFLVGNEIYMIDRTLSIPRAVRLPTPDATNVAMYPLQNSVILAGVDKTIQKYSFGADKITATYPGLTEIPRCLIVSESGKRIAAGGGSAKTVTSWDADTEA
ncbi:MAG: WD40 repeat domain-containing protein, partial [Planctomycetota bacterium]